MSELVLIMCMSVFNHCEQFDKDTQFYCAVHASNECSKYNDKELEKNLTNFLTKKDLK